jgi:DNA-binding response OmpR family regulator
MQQVWGYGSEVTEAVVKVNILRIRRKIEVNPSKPVLILAVAGEGYMFADPGDMKL